MRYIHRVSISVHVVVLVFCLSCENRMQPSALPFEPTPKIRNWSDVKHTMRDSLEDFELVEDSVHYQSFDFLYETLIPIEVDSVAQMIYSSKDTIFNGLKQWLYVDFIYYSSCRAAEGAAFQTYVEYGDWHQYDNRFAAYFKLEGVILRLTSPGLHEFKSWSSITNIARIAIERSFGVEILRWVECPFEEKCNVEAWTK
jgi:hypothetical protein